MVQLIKQIKGYYYINPFLSLSLSISLFSFAGVPPLVGFFAKQNVFSSALDNGYIFISLVAIITSVISAVYYLAIIKQIFFYEPDYIINTELMDFSAKGLVTKDSNNDVGNAGEKVVIQMNSIVISSYLSLTISVITFVITLFILIPQHWLGMANIMTLILFKI